MVPVGVYTHSAEAAVGCFDFATALEIDFYLNVIWKNGWEPWRINILIGFVIMKVTLNLQWQHDNASVCVYIE